MIKVGVIGTGSFGEKRAAAVTRCKNAQLVAVADTDLVKAKNVSEKLHVQYLTVEEILHHDSIDVVAVCVPNKYHAELSTEALSSGKHVLCEKPMARNVDEATRIVSVVEKTGKFFKTGSNHRCFGSVRKAYEIVQSGFIGDVISFNGRIGNDGERVKQSWFWDKELSGGGTLIDNGCHLLDLARWFIGDFVEGTGMVSNVYWKDCPVEDTATGVFTTKDGKMATINSSWRQLSGYFHFEVNGADGYITVDGRFDTHGGDNLYWQSTRGRGEIYSLNFGHVKPDSYVVELEEFFDDIMNNRQPKPSHLDGLAVIKMIETIYKSNNQTLKM